MKLQRGEPKCAQYHRFLEALLGTEPRGVELYVKKNSMRDRIYLRVRAIDKYRFQDTCKAHNVNPGEFLRLCMAQADEFIDCLGVTSTQTENRLLARDQRSTRTEIRSGSR